MRIRESPEVAFEVSDAGGFLESTECAVICRTVAVEICSCVRRIEVAGDTFPVLICEVNGDIRIRKIYNGNQRGDLGYGRSKDG